MVAEDFACAQRNAIEIFVGNGLLHNPPKGDRREVPPSVENLRVGWLCHGQVGLWLFRSLRRFRDIASLHRVRCWFWSFRSLRWFRVRCRFCARASFGGGFVPKMFASAFWCWVPTKSGKRGCGKSRAFRVNAFSHK